jgi:hypothetical protein
MRPRSSQDSSSSKSMTRIFPSRPSTVRAGGHDDTLRQLDGLVTDCRDAWVVLFNLGDAVPLCPQHAVARDVRQQTSVQLFCDRSQLSLDQVSPWFGLMPVRC